MEHTFLFTDLVGFTALAAAEGDDRAAGPRAAGGPRGGGDQAEGRRADAALRARGGRGPPRAADRQRARGIPRLPGRAGGGAPRQRRLPRERLVREPRERGLPPLHG